MERIAACWRNGRVRGEGCSSSACAGGSARPRFAEAEAFAQIVQTKRVGKRGSVAAGAGGVVRFENLIDDPAGDEDAEDAIFVGQRDEDGEDNEMNDSLGVLAVVHGTDTGDDAEKGGQAGIWLSAIEWRE